MTLEGGVPSEPLRCPAAAARRSPRTDYKFPCVLDDSVQAVVTVLVERSFNNSYNSVAVATKTYACHTRRNTRRTNAAISRRPLVVAVAVGLFPPLRKTFNPLAVLEALRPNRLEQRAYFSPRRTNWIYEKVLIRIPQKIAHIGSH